MGGSNPAGNGEANRGPAPSFVVQGWDWLKIFPNIFSEVYSYMYYASLPLKLFDILGLGRLTIRN